MTSREPPSPRQQAALLHIRGQLLMTGRPPTRRELGELLGVQVHAVWCVLMALERKGWVRRGPRQATRTLRLVD